MSKIKKYWWLVLLIPVVGLAGFVIWAQTPLGPMPEALAALEFDGQVQVETQPWLIFSPVEDDPKTGFIFYPGGRVDPRSYAPLAHTIASQGYLVVIVPMPLNLAIFAPDKAVDVISSYPEIHTWAIGGHSLGGAMAANYIYQNPDLARGLVLWAAYPAANNDLSSSTDLAATSISATLDGLAAPDKIDTSRTLLPANTRWAVIDGGNHAQFGWYGLQPGDNPATITREDQQTQIIQFTENLLSEITEGL